MSFIGRTAIVTGAARGIGRGIGLELGRRGCNVAFNYIHSEAAAESLVAELRNLGRKALAYKVDVTDFGAVDSMVKQVREEFGRIDFLVNNAGITRDKLIVRMTERDWDDVIETNLKGAFNFCRAAVNHMMRARFGAILNVTSVSGLIGLPGQTNYAASKAGMIGLTKALAKEVASRNITVNALALGLVETDMTSSLSEEYREKLQASIPLGRYGNVEEVARIATFLLSEDTRYVTGQVIQVDGGLAM